MTSPKPTLSEGGQNPPAARTASSELSQLLSSLGIASSSSSGSSTQDPLITARQRLLRLKADAEKGTETLRRLIEIQSAASGSEETIAVRITPPVTDSSVNEETSPSLIVLVSSESRQRLQRAHSQPGTSYAQFDQAPPAVEAVRAVAGAAITEFEALRKDLVSQAQARIAEALKQVNPVTGEEMPTLMDEDGKVLNEEGLPFVDPSEAYENSIGATHSHASASLAGFDESTDRSNRLTGEERRKWIEETFKRIEADGEDEGDFEVANTASNLGRASAGPSRIQTPADRSSSGNKSPPQLPNVPPSSASQPPLKPALKPSLKKTARPPAMQRFGSAGLRKGFLNMNPSSPAAVASSNPIDELPNGSEMHRSSSVQSSIAGKKRADLVDTLDDERLSRSLEIPTKKKSVRIKSPSPQPPRERSPPQQITAPRTNTPRSGGAITQHPDDEGVDDEAARILSLLGPEIVSGTPMGDVALQQLKQEQEAAAEQQAQEAKRVREEKAKKEKEKTEDKRPAVGMSVMERSRSKPAQLDVQPEIQKAKMSAFKKGFLNQAPRGKLVSPYNPESSQASQADSKDPRKTLGMSALERSFINDAPIEAEREAQGLTPAVPHARPSKAYAEKMEKKKRGEIDSSTAQADPTSDSIVGTGSEEPSKVRFQISESSAEDTSRDVEMPSEDGAQDAVDGGLEDDYVEIDEHDEEATARAAYASGDVIEDEEDIDMNGDTHVDEDNDSDWDLESYDGYDSSDLADLEPTFDGLVTDLENAELAREYALAKAKQMTSRAEMSEERRRELESAISGELAKAEQDDEDGNLWNEEEIDGRDLSTMAGVSEREGAGPNAKMSRFRASRIVKALAMGEESVGRQDRGPTAGLVPGAEDNDRKADEAGHELAHLLENAANLGPAEGPSVNDGSDNSATPPIMILPSLTPLRYPRSSSSSSSTNVPGISAKPPSTLLTESTPLPREGIDLAGESDEDEQEEQLMQLMRARIEEKEAREVARQQRENGGPSTRSSAPATTTQRSGKGMVAPPSLAPASLAGRAKVPPSSSTTAALSSSSPAQSQQAGSESIEVELETDELPQAPAKKVSRFKANRMAGGA